MNLANKITILRLLSVPFFITCLVYYTPGKEGLRFTALLIFGLAAITDAVDGYIARVKKQRTELGTFLDPLADKILLVSAFVVILFTPGFAVKPPAWAVIIIVSRDVLIVSGMVIMALTGMPVKIRPNMIGKATTFMQMLTVFAVLLQFRFSFLIWNTTALLTIVSGISYVLRASKNINENPETKPS